MNTPPVSPFASPNDAILPGASMRWALGSLALSMLLPSFGTSIANVALPTLSTAFSVSFQAVQWVVLTFLLAITSLVVSAGRYGDIFGKRRLLLLGVGLFSLASLLCGLAPNFALLLAARALQGVGAAFMLALTVAMLGEIVPKDKVGSAMGLLGTMSAVGTTLGPSLGGFLIAQFGWQAIFLVNVPLGVVTFLLAYRFLPADHQGSEAAKNGLDNRGTLLLALTLGAYALAMTIGRGQFNFTSQALLFAAAVGLGLFVLVERRAVSPLIRLTMFRDLKLSAGLLMSALVSTVMMATLVVGPFHLSQALGLGMGFVGLALSVGPLVAALAGVPAGRLVDRAGTQATTLVGLGVMGCGAMLLWWLPIEAGLVGYVAPIVAVTAGYALFQAANNTATMVGISANQRGAISGLLTLSRNLGLITGASVMGAVFAFASASPDGISANADTVAYGMRFTFAVAAALIGLAFAVAFTGHTFALAQSNR